MKKFFKCTIIVIALFLISFTSVYAVGIDMDLNTNIDNSINNENELDNSTDILNNANLSNTSSANTSSNYISNTPKISTSGNEENFSLSISDIVNIILISVGLVLIFLAVAILLKLR